MNNYIKIVPYQLKLGKIETNLFDYATIIGKSTIECT